MFFTVALATNPLICAACPFPPDDKPLLALRSVIDRAIVRIQTSGAAKGCTDIGTGFIVSASGLIVTAGHLVPASCANQSVKIRWTRPDDAAQLSESVEAEVVARSELDIAVLRPLEPIDERLSYLQLHLSDQPLKSAFKNVCVLLASHFAGQDDTLTSFAEITSVTLTEDNRRWAIGGDGFNPTRSGSPVITADAQGLAVFVARPGTDPADRVKQIENRAIIVPLRNVAKADMNLEQLVSGTGPLLPLHVVYPPTFSATVAIEGTDGTIAPRTTVRNSYGISFTIPGGQIDPDLPTYILRDGKLIAQDSLGSALAALLFEGGSVAREVRKSLEIKATLGFAFVPNSYRLDVASHNPPAGPLPNRPCTGGDDWNCYALIEPDKKSLELRLSFFPGVDGRRSWLDAEVQIEEQPMN